MPSEIEMLPGHPMETSSIAQQAFLPFVLAELSRREEKPVPPLTDAEKNLYEVLASLVKTDGYKELYVSMNDAWHLIDEKRDLFSATDKKELSREGLVSAILFLHDNYIKSGYALLLAYVLHFALRTNHVQSIGDWSQLHASVGLVITAVKNHEATGATHDDTKYIKGATNKLASYVYGREFQPLVEQLAQSLKKQKRQAASTNSPARV